MEYQATFGIDCGVSPGYGVKYPDFVKEEKIISAESPQVAYQNAMVLAGKFADNYLSNPKTGFTTVQLISLRDLNISGSSRDVSFDASTSVVKRSRLEHLLSTAS